MTRGTRARHVVGTVLGVLTVSTAEGTDLGHNSGEFVSGTNRSHG